MKFLPTPILGAVLIETDVFSDERGSFLENYRSTPYAELGADPFVQDNLSRSKKAVLRGLHFNVRRPQAQLLTVVRGKIFDVVVDLRRHSATFGQWFGTELSEIGIRQIYMAPGFAHGFCVLSDWADLHYKVTSEYDQHDEFGLLWSDQELDIAWPLNAPIVSSRDAAFPCLSMLTKDELPCVSMAQNCPNNS